MFITFNKTRFAENGQCLLYAKLPKGSWSFFHMDLKSHIQPARVGHIYKSKSELLADCERYGSEWGF